MQLNIPSVALPSQNATPKLWSCPTNGTSMSFTSVAALHLYDYTQYENQVAGDLGAKPCTNQPCPPPNLTCLIIWSEPNGALDILSLVPLLSVQRLGKLDGPHMGLALRHFSVDRPLTLLLFILLYPPAFLRTLPCLYPVTHPKSLLHPQVQSLRSIA